MKKSIERVKEKRERNQMKLLETNSKRNIIRVKDKREIREIRDDKMKAKDRVKNERLERV